MTGPRGLLLVAVVAFAAISFLAGLGHGVLRHGDEGRFVIAAREVLAGGPWLVPTTLGEPLVIKPPLFVWLVALAAKVHGRLDELAARLPVALSAIATAGALYLLGARLFGRRAGLVAGLLFASALGPFLLAREVLPDMPMTAASTLAVLGAVIAYQEARAGAALLFASALALGVHFKLLAGLVPPVATVLLLAALRRESRPLTALRPWLGAPVFVALLLPWLVRFLVIDDFLIQIDAETLSGRAWQSWRTVYESPLRTLQIFLEALFPWSVFLPAAAVYLWRRRAGLRDDPVLLPLLWLLAAVGMSIPVHTVRWRYLLPAIPPAVLILARAWDAALEGRTTGWERRLLVGPLGGMLAVFALAGAAVLAGLDPARLAGAEAPPPLRQLPGALVPMAWAAGGILGLLWLGNRTRAALLLCAGLAALSLASLEPLTRAERDRPVDPRPFAAEVRRITGGRPIRFNGGSGLVSAFHFYLNAPTSLLPAPLIAGVVNGPAREYVVLPAATLEELRRQGAISAATEILADGRFGHYHLVLVRGGAAEGGAAAAPRR